MTNPKVTLIDCTANPFNLSIASARTCYSSKGILYPHDMVKDEKSLEIRDKIAKSTKKAGHLTTRQHPQFIFALENISRQFVWSFLHSHPYYNSEQVSQRYVEVKKENFYIPNILDAQLHKLYRNVIEESSNAYQQMIELLHPYIQKEYFTIYKARAEYPEKWQNPIKKKCLEVARYLLPVATLTYMYHTINGLTLHRYYRLVNSFHVPEEQRIVIQQMVNEVQKVDSLFVSEMDDPIPLEQTTEYSLFTEFYQHSSFPKDNGFINEFDSKMADRYSKLVSYSENAEDILADSMRAVLGIHSSKLSKEGAIARILDPSLNRSLSSTLNETSLNPVSRAMFNTNYTFQKKISHTADSQDQRHRMVPASRPILITHFSGKPDFITPAIVRLHPELMDYYSRKMTTIFEGINQFIDAGGSLEYASYLFPNAIPIRFYESGDLLNLHHKWKSRLCFNAQEEIFHASIEEVGDIALVHPNIAKYIYAPCKLRYRANIKPYCPEGDRYCGVQVWKLEELKSFFRLI